jgi:hypothetical protein
MCDRSMTRAVRACAALTLQPGQVLGTPFTARASGRYAVTSHGFGGAGSPQRHGRALLYIEVQPR